MRCLAARRVPLAREGEILRCPWHGWEFELNSGRSSSTPTASAFAAYQVTVEPSEHEDPQIETYALSVEDGIVLVHL